MSKNIQYNQNNVDKKINKLKYNLGILNSFEYFLAQKDTQDNLIQNLINDYQPKIETINQDGKNVQVEKPGFISLKTIFSAATSFFKAPLHTFNLLKFYSNQKDYNTPEFQKALLNSNKTWEFVDRTADNLEKLSTLMNNMGVDLFQEGKIFDQAGMNRLKGALKNPEFISTIKNLAIASREKNPNYLELSYQMLDAIDKAPNASAFLTEKGKAIEEYIKTSLDSQIKQEQAFSQKWQEISKITNNQKAKIKKIKLLKQMGIVGKQRDEALKTGILPKGLEANIAEYGLQADNMKDILKIVPILLDSPGELKEIVNSIDKGKYSDIARQLIDLAEKKPKIKEYLNDNREIFGKIIVATMKNNENFTNSGLSGQVYNIVPLLFDNPKALNEIMDIYDNGNYVNMSAKIYDLVEKDQNIKNYFAKNSEGFEKLATSIMEDTIQQSRKNLEQENIQWKSLGEEKQRIYLDTDPKWKDFSNADKDRMIKQGKLDDMSDSFSKYGVNEKDIGSIAHIAMLTFDNPKHFSNLLKDFEKSDFIGVTQNMLTLFAESPEVNAYLNQEKTLIGKIITSNLADTPAFKDLDVTDLVPFFLKNPNELKEIINLVQKEKYNEVTNKIFELAKSDRSLADFLAKNKSSLAKAAMYYTGFDKYEISEDIADIFVNFTTENNLSKLHDIAKLAEKEQWIKVGSELANLIDKDPDFRISLKNNKENINKIIEVVLLKNPSLRSSISALETDALANNMLSDPGGIRDLLNAYESGNKTSLATQVAKFATQKIFNSEFRGAIYNSAINWIYGKGEKQQELANSIVEALDKRMNFSEKVILSDFVKEAFIEIAQNIGSEKDRATFLKQINNKNFFDGVTIQGFGTKPRDFKNLAIDNNQFVNTKFINVSFEGTKITNTSFHGASFERVNFNGAIIDGATLESLLPAIRSSDISLKGVKIIGSLENLDLKDISFREADLSAVTSMKNTTISGANLMGAKLPSDNKVLTESFGLESAAFNSSVVSPEQYKLNKNIICATIAEQLTKKSASEGNILSDQEAIQLKQKIVQLYDNQSEIGKNFRAAINNYPQQLLTQAFPEKEEFISHVSQYKGQASHQLSMIYNHIKELNKIESVLVADIIAQDITKNLFDKGDNRGKDGLEIQKKIEKAIKEIEKEYKISAKELLSNINKDSMIKEVTEKIKSKTKYTTAGMMSGGIYLPENVLKANTIKSAIEKVVLSEKTMHHKISNQIIKKAKKDFIEIEDEKTLKQVIENIYNDQSNIGIRFKKALEKDLDILLKSKFPEDIDNIKNFSDFKGSAKHQLSIIYNNINSPKQIEAAFAADIMSDKIVANIFNEGVNRGQDALQIQEVMTEIVQQFAKSNKVSMQELLESSKLDDFIEEITKDIKLKTKYTTAGMISGGIYLPEDAISQEMIDDIIVKMNMQLGDRALNKDEKEMITEIAESIAGNVFGDDAKNTNKKDLEQITQLLEKTFHALKIANQNIDLERTIIQNKDELIGNLEKGYISTTGEGLSKLFYDNTSSLGGFSGKINSNEFKNNLKEKIEKSIEGNISKIIPKVSKIQQKDSGKDISLVTKNKAKEIGQNISESNSKNSHEKIISKSKKASIVR